MIHTFSLVFVLLSFLMYNLILNNISNYILVFVCSRPPFVHLNLFGLSIFTFFNLILCILLCLESFYILCTVVHVVARAGRSGQ